MCSSPLSRGQSCLHTSLSPHAHTHARAHEQTHSRAHRVYPRTVWHTQFVSGCAHLQVHAETLVVDFTSAGIPWEGLQCRSIMAGGSGIMYALPALVCPSWTEKVSPTGVLGCWVVTCVAKWLDVIAPWHKTRSTTSLSLCRVSALRYRLCGACRPSYPCGQTTSTYTTRRSPME